MSRPSQNDLILSALKQGEKLTALDAVQRFGCLRLAARVDDLKRAGHPIHSEMIERNGKRYALYSLTTPAPRTVQVGDSEQCVLL